MPKLGKPAQAAERQLGEFIDAAKRAGQIRTPEEGRPKSIEGHDTYCTLKSQGITGDLSARAQKLFAVPAANAKAAAAETNTNLELSRATIVPPLS